MRLSPLALAISLTALPFVAQAAEKRGWSGEAEFGLAVASGNAESETVNGKFAFNREADQWFYNVNSAALRAKADNSLSANRYELGAKYGYKFGERLYLFGTLRHDRDDFASYDWQTIFSTGVGYRFIDNEATSLVGEFGPGVRRVQPIDALIGVPPVAVSPDTESDTIVRGSLDFKHQLTESTALHNLFLVESGGGNTFMQNDLGVSVKMSERFALKAGYQLRRNTEVPVGVEKIDRLFTTNLVVGF